MDGAWGAITQFDKTTHPGSIAESMQPIMENVEAGPSKGDDFIDNEDWATEFSSWTQ